MRVLYMDKSFDEISKSCLNHSSSKQLYSFSKEKRFRYSTENNQRLNLSIPSKFQIDKLKNLGFSFPKVRKQLVFQNQKEASYNQINHINQPIQILKYQTTINFNKPSPLSYSLVNQNESSFRKYRGITMGCKLNTCSSQRQVKSQRSTPGPSQYELKSYRSQKKTVFGKQRKVLKYPLQLRKGIESPGPAAYVNHAEKLQNFVAKFERVRTTKILQLKAKYNEYKNSQQLKNSMKVIDQSNPQKVYLNLKFKKSKMPVFQKHKRPQFGPPKKGPGPADYSNFTEFARIEKKSLLLDHLSQKSKYRNIKSRVYNKSKSLLSHSVPINSKNNKK